jgi:hypothetical protein
VAVGVALRGCFLFSLLDAPPAHLIMMIGELGMEMESLDIGVACHVIRDFVSREMRVL